MYGSRLAVLRRTFVYLHEITRMTMKRFFIFIALMLILPFAESCAQQQKEIRTVAILGDSYSTFDGYIPEGNACWYFTTPQGENDVVSV